MIECRFSLELTKNGIQKSVYAKTGEVNSRMLVVTLTQNGKVYDLAEHTAVVFLETGENFSAKIVNDTVQAVIPDAFSEPQVRICDLRISKDEKVLYSPKFEIVFEESFGNKAESESLVNGVRYVLWNEFEDSIKHLEDDRHSHENKNTLDKLTTSEDGELLFDGLPIQSNNEQNQISAEDVAYENPNLQNKSGTVKSALDEAIGFVTGDLTNTVANLVTNSHSHSNKSVLDKFDENESGEPIYNGRSMSQNYKTVEFTDGGLTSSQVSYGHYVIGTFNKILPDNIKIKEIRVVDNDGNIKRLVDLTDGDSYPLRVVTYLDNKYDEVNFVLWTLAYIVYPFEMDDHVYDGIWYDHFFVDYYED